MALYGFYGFYGFSIVSASSMALKRVLLMCHAGVVSNEGEKTPMGSILLVVASRTLQIQ
jgi:hypothetical protein